ncbi:MAG: S-layer homology domain-containing protein, partial [Oscillibacter sp.]|nr:S-layer homology domain-containing protein [Oscillibacter sp.]
MGKLNRLRLLLTGSLVILLCATAASAFSDTQGHPSEAAINKWGTEYGLIPGYGDGTFRPNDSVTKGAFAGIIDRMMHFRAKSPASTFRDTAGNQWEDAILKLHASAIYIAENGYAEPYAATTRQQAVTMIAHTFDLAADSILPHYADDESIAGYARGPVSEMTERGYLEGVADRSFRPGDPITRADVVRIFDNLLSAVVMTQTPFSQDVTGNVLVSSQGGATLRDMYITGDLYVAPGVIGTVLLDNVTIGG